MSTGSDFNIFSQISALGGVFNSTTPGTPAPTITPTTNTTIVTSIGVITSASGTALTSSSVSASITASIFKPVASVPASRLTSDSRPASASASSTTVTSSSSTSTSSNVESVTSAPFAPTTTDLVIKTSFIADGKPQTTIGADLNLAKTNTSAVAGGVGGGVGGLIVLILLMAFFIRRARKQNRDIANFDPQEFRHTGKEIRDDDSFDGFNIRPPARFERYIVPSLLPTSESGSIYDYDNFAGLGSHGAHLPKSRPVPQDQFNHGATSSNKFNHAATSSDQFNHAATSSGQVNHGATSSGQVNHGATSSGQVNHGATSPDQVNHGATSSKSSEAIHLNYKPRALSSLDEPAPLPPYTEFHFDQQDLPSLPAQNESAPANDYVGYSASPHHATPGGSLISGSQCDLPPLPPKPKELQSEGEFPSQSVSPFSDPNLEPPTSLRPGFIDDGRNSSTHTVIDSNEDAYDGISN